MKFFKIRINKKITIKVSNKNYTKFIIYNKNYKILNKFNRFLRKNLNKINKS